MPLYDTECRSCGVKDTRMIALVNLDMPIVCNTCNGLMDRLISAPMIRGDIEAYTCPITGKVINGRKAHEDNLKRHNCRVLETGEADIVKKNRERADQQMDKNIESTVEQFIEKLPTQKKEQLAKEVLGGADITITRS